VTPPPSPLLLDKLDLDVEMLDKEITALYEESQQWRKIYQVEDFYFLDLCVFLTNDIFNDTVVNLAECSPTGNKNIFKQLTEELTQQLIPQQQ
jgi:hypothetical protein